MTKRLSRASSHGKPHNAIRKQVTYKILLVGRHPAPGRSVGRSAAGRSVGCWSVGRLLVGRLLVGRLLVGRSVGRHPAPGRSARGRSVGRSAGLPVGRSVGRSVGRPAGRPACRSACRSACRPACRLPKSRGREGRALGVSVTAPSTNNFFKKCKHACRRLANHSPHISPYIARTCNRSNCPIGKRETVVL
jgi:hypothetical protein